MTAGLPLGEEGRLHRRGRDIIVVGASAGGVEALRMLVAGWPADLAAAIFVVLHVSPECPSVLPRILTRAGQLEAIHPADGEPIRHGRIYIAPPDRHLLVQRGFVRVMRGPRENGARPAVDPLFRTAARAYGPRVVAIVLSGNLGDGVAGVLEVKERGGIVIVQEPGEAAFAEMPRNAIAYSRVDHCVPVAGMGRLVIELNREPVNGDEAPEDPFEKSLATVSSES